MLGALRRPLKRLFDIAAAMMILLAVWPLLMAVTAMIWLSDGRPIIFRHRRVGRNGKPFNCLKFRSMGRGADRALADLLGTSPTARAEWDKNRKLRHDPRVLGAVGRFLRRTSLDELPQLLNVLRGEMSLVGPRPVIAAELVHYQAQSKWYLSTRPGLTGPWQISGRSDTSYATRVILDVEYAKNLSLRRDLVILFRTARVVLHGKGAY